MKSIWCIIGLHHWDKDMTDEHGRQRCRKCGRYYSRSIYYGIWALIVSVVFLLFVMASRCSGEVVKESYTIVSNGDRNGFIVVWVVVDTTTGARVMITGNAAVLLPSVPLAPITHKPPPPKPEQAPDGMEHMSTWANAETLDRLATAGWKVEGMDASKEPVHGLRYYNIIRPRLFPGQVEAPVKP